MLGTLLILWVQSQRISSTTGYYAKMERTRVDIHGHLQWKEVEEILRPAGTIYGRSGHSYEILTNSGRTLYTERDESNYNWWWRAPSLGRVGKSIAQTPESDAAGKWFADQLKVGPSYGSQVPPIPLPSRTAFGLSFRGERWLYDDKGIDEAWKYKVSESDDIVLLSVANHPKSGVQGSRLIALRPATRRDLERFDISKHFPNARIDTLGFYKACFWVESGKWPENKKSPAKSN